MGVFESLLNKSFRVWSLLRESDGQGGWPESWSAGDAIEGRMRPATSKEREEAALEEREISHVFYCGADETVTRGCQLEDVEDGVMFEVKGVREPSRAGHHLEIDCLELQAEVSEEAGS